MDEGKSVKKSLSQAEKQVLQYLKKKSADRHIKVEHDIVVIEEDAASAEKDSDIR
jgi:hypothetical protein